LKLEKRSAGTLDQEPAAQPEETSGGKKPVIMYIMILFIAAFLLMALSFFMHQRSNSEAIGQLQDSVSALQAGQATQDANIQLQNDLKVAMDEKLQLETQLEEVNGNLSAAEEEVDSLKGQLKAMESLYILQQQFSARDYDECKKTVEAMEKDGLDKLLPNKASADGVTSPAERFLQLKEALNNR